MVYHAKNREAVRRQAGGQVGDGIVERKLAFHFHSDRRLFDLEVVNSCERLERPRQRNSSRHALIEKICPTHAAVEGQNADRFYFVQKAAWPSKPFCRFPRVDRTIDRFHSPPRV